MRSCVVIAVASALAAVSVAAQAQQGSVSNSRLMFDPNSVGTPGNRPQPLTPPATTTTGQNAQQQPAARQVIAPQPQAAPPAAKPAARAAATAPAKPAPVRRAAPTERVMNDTTRGSDRLDGPPGAPRAAEPRPAVVAAGLAGLRG